MRALRQLPKQVLRNKDHNVKENVAPNGWWGGKKKLIADKTREPGKCWKVSGTLFEVRAAEAAARHLQVINTCRGQPVFFGEGIWEYVSLKKHSCVYTRSRVRVCVRTCACSFARTPARTHTHTYSRSSWGVNFTPRPCEC